MTYQSLNLTRMVVFVFGVGMLFGIACGVWGTSLLHCPPAPTIVKTKTVYRRLDLRDFAVNPNFAALMKMSAQRDKACGLDYEIVRKD